MAEEKENKIEAILGEEENASEKTEETKETPPQEIEIDGQKYTIDQIKEALQAARDYQYLVPEFTRKSQRLAELERQLETLQAAKEKVAEDPAKAEAKRVLKELGVPFLEDLEQKIADVKEEIHLEKVLDYLEKKYDGSHGEPPFDRDEVMDFALRQFGDQDRIDLEYAYKKLHADFWDKLPTPEKKVVKTERGGGKTEFSLPKKKITFEPKGEGEVSVEEAAKEFLKSRRAWEEE
jgi:DNA repair exonuclease SbcCD ATPase subunit